MYMLRLYTHVHPLILKMPTETLSGVQELSLSKFMAGT